MSNNAYAQDTEVPSATQRAPDSMDKVPDEYIEEAMAFYDVCAGDNVQNEYYNCECLSLAYLDERKKQGRLGTASSIRSAIINECRDAVGAAGSVYTNCLARANGFEPGTDPEKYCECVANTYVETLNKTTPRVNSTTIVSYQTMAYAACSNPNAEKPGMMFEKQP